MEQIEFVKSGLMTSRIGLGTWAMGGWMWGGTDEAQSIATIRSAIDRGVTLIDTAPVYGFGRSEEIVGKALEGSLRHKVTIATKVGLAWKDGAVYRDFAPPASARKSKIRCDVYALMSSTFTRCIGAPLHLALAGQSIPLSSLASPARSAAGHKQTCLCGHADPPPRRTRRGWSRGIKCKSRTRFSGREASMLATCSEVARTVAHVHTSGDPLVLYPTEIPASR